MKIVKDTSPSFNIEIEEGEEINLRLDSKNAITVTKRKGEGTITLGFHDEPLLKNGGYGIKRGAGRMNSFAQIEFNLKQEK